MTAWNQRGCLSPHVIYVEERGAVESDKFAQLLAVELAQREAGEPRGKISTQLDASVGCLDRLWTEVLDGTRRFKIYRQLKMYNDPALNPAIYLAE